MKTFAELKAFCEKNNVRYEVNAKRSEKWYNPYSGQDEDCILGWYFGMNNIAGKSGKSEYQWTWFYCYCEGLMFNIACLINTMSRKGVDANYNPFTGHDYPIKKILESENLESL